MYECEGWTIKKAECWRTEAFELWCWRRLLRIPWTARRSNQSILKEINPEYLLEGLMWNWSSNTLATWCEEPTHWKRPWYWERLRAGEEGDNRGWNGWIASPTQWTCIWAISSGGSDSKEYTCNAGDPGLIPGSGRFPGEKKEYPPQYSCLENSMDKGVWQATVHRVTKSWTWLSNWHFTSLHFTSLHF